MDIAQGLPGAWVLTCLYANEAEANADMAAIERLIDDFVAKYANLNVASGFDRLAQALANFEKLQRQFLVEETIDEQLGKSKPELYAKLQEASASSTATQARLQLLADWRQQQLKKLEFFLEIFDGASQERRQELLEASELAEYRSWLTRRFMLPTATSTAEARQAAAEAEATATRLTTKLGAAFSKASAMVWKGGREQRMTLSGITSQTYSSNSREWKSAAAALPKLLAALEVQAFAELTAALRAGVAKARLRGGDVETVRFASDTLSPDTVNSLIETILNAKGVANEFYELKAMLEAEQQKGRLWFARRRVPYGSLTQYGWPEAVDLIHTFLSRINPAFAAEFERALAEGYIDAEPRDGKTSQTACWWGFGLQPMLAVNFTGTLTNIAQIIHEFFHYLAALEVSRLRDGLSYNTRVPLAETQAVTLEQLVPVVLADKLSDNDKLVLLMARLETIMSSVFLQGVATAFEQRLYAELQRGKLTLSRLKSLFVKYMRM